MKSYNKNLNLFKFIKQIVLNEMITFDTGFTIFIAPPSTKVRRKG